MACFKSAASAMIATAALGAQPCIAATQDRDFSAMHSATLVFVGLNVRMPLGAAATAKPAARLQLTTAFNVRDARTGTMQTFKGDGLELGASKRGQPTLYLNGQSTAAMKTRLKMSGTTKAVLIVGGVLVLLGAVLFAAANSGLGDTCPEFEGSRDHCVNP